jgi:hypothetical protein
MPNELKKRGGGWYFIRLYDQNDDLIDSMDFRFMNALKDVKISPYTPLPGKEGHQPVEICFEHEPELEITPMGVFLTLDRTNDTTKVIIPSKHDFDLTEWKLKSENAELSIKILIERVWWLIKRGNESSEENFQDKPVNIHRDYCRTISEDSIIIMYPKEGWAKSVFLGFDDKTRREYHVKVKDKFSTINLRDFSDIMDLTPSTISAEIKLWIDIRTQGSCETIICKITPEESPPPQVPPEIPEEPQIFIRLDSDPYSRPSCNNCDYARTQAEGFSPPIFWCKKNKWFYANRLKFYGHFGYCLCGDWEGEYQDIIGEWQYELRQEEIELLVKKGLKK